MAEKLDPLYKLLKTEVPINITSELKKKTIDSVKKALSDACELPSNELIPGMQLDSMTDASFRSAGYALMIEDNPDQKIQSKQKTYTPVAFCSKVFSAGCQVVYTLKQIYWHLTWHFSSLHTFCGQQQSQQIFSQTKNPSHVSSKRRHFRRHRGMHVTICCNLTSK